MSKSRWSNFLFAIVLMAVFSTPAFGQWKTQSFTLNPGWNSIFLEVQPEADETATVFQGVPLESVWTWNRRYATPQFFDKVDDPNSLVPEQPEWLHYFPAGTEESATNNLFIMRGGLGYMVKLGGTTPATLTITGKPVVRPVDWMANSFNLVGFHIDPASSPSFAEYFAPSSAHAGNDFYRLDTSGTWVKVATPEAEKVNPGEAYWVYCEGHSTYSGPVSVAFEQGNSLNFSRILNEQKLRIKNDTPAVNQISIAKIASEPPPSLPSVPALAGEVPMSHWVIDKGDGTGSPGWLPLDGTLNKSIQPGEELTLRLAVRRPDMAVSADPDALYQSLLEIRDGSGSMLSLPVLARGMTPGGSGVAAAGAAVAAAAVSNPRAGLWVGTAVLDKVNYVSDPLDRTTPQPTSSEFAIRLIIHVDSTGQAKLLQQVALMWEKGTYKTDPNDTTKQIVDVSGKFVLIEDENEITKYEGSSVRDGTQVGRRISSAAFSFTDPVLMSGAFDGTLISDVIPLGFNDPLNPFKHKYHPNHDNVLADKPARVGDESYDITRKITLLFTPNTDPEGLRLPGWGDDQVGGTYEEEIAMYAKDNSRGFHDELLRVAGTFRLNQVSRIDVLNNGL